MSKRGREIWQALDAKGTARSEVSGSGHALCSLSRQHCMRSKHGNSPVHGGVRL